MADTATPGIRKRHLIKLANGKYATKYPHDSNPGTVLSVQPNGSIETRPDTAIGPWEEAELSTDGRELAYTPEGFLYLMIVRDV